MKVKIKTTPRTPIHLKYIGDLIDGVEIIDKKHNNTLSRTISKEIVLNLNPILAEKKKFWFSKRRQTKPLIRNLADIDSQRHLTIILPKHINNSESKKRGRQVSRIEVSSLD